jgi:hypothetical protein
MLFVILFFALPVNADVRPPDSARSKFYDFNEQIIDGEIRKPTALYTDARTRARFDRLLRLKKSFLPELFRTSKNRVFK